MFSFAPVALSSSVPAASPTTIAPAVDFSAVQLVAAAAVAPPAAPASVRVSPPLATAASAPVLSGPLRPTHIRVPPIGLDAPVIGVGVTANGEMAVPSGASRGVGWYQGGVVPGSGGSAVFDAHVFAAFSKLRYVKAGESMYVTMSDGSTRRFVVSVAETFPLASLSSSQLFRPTSSSDLNLVTCAGSLTPDHSTYDHRLIVYSTLAK